MRVFIAISLPTDIKEGISSQTDPLKTQFPRVKWEQPNKLHITLAFLGKIDKGRLEDLKTGIAEVTKNSQAFNLTVLNGLSYFYKRHADSIIFINVQDPNHKLKTFYQKLQKSLKSIGFFLPERLSPHITVGRLKRIRFPNERKRILADIAKVEPRPLGEFVVKALDLYESLYSLEKSTSQYKLIKAFTLS